MKYLFLYCLLLLIPSTIILAQPVDGIVNSLQTDRQKADTLKHFALQVFYNGKYDSAALRFEKALPYAEKTGDAELIGYLQLSIANSFILDNAAAKALPWLSKTDGYYPQDLSYKLREKYWLLWGMAYERLHKPDSAIYFFHQAEAMNEKENPYQNWIVYSQLGNLLYRAENYTEAEKYFNKAYEITNAGGIRSDHGIMLYEFANFYYAWGKPERFAYLVDEQQKFVQSGKKDWKDPTHRMLFVDWKKKSFDEKISFMKKVKEEFVKNGNASQTAHANLYLIDFYEQEKQLARALAYAEENEKLVNPQMDITNQYVHAKTLYRLLKANGKTGRALEIADRMFALKDSMISLQQRETLLAMEAKYQSAQKDRDLAQLNTENQLAASRLSKEKRTRWLLTGLVVLLLIASLAVLYFFQKQKARGAIVARQADEMQTLMKEIHHRVKNNLQVISSLLDLHSLTIDDSEASQAIRESRNRVYSMALIHQNLYSEGNIRGIEMPDYISKLVQSLFASYNVRENKISLETEIDPILLDVDFVIPIGLVLNELISNTLKYAFQHKESGTLHITMKKIEDELFLKVKDSGDGFPKGMNVYQANSFGYKLIRAFAQKLKARLEVFNDNGACVILHIRKFSPAV